MPIHSETFFSRHVTVVLIKLFNVVLKLSPINSFFVDHYSMVVTLSRIDVVEFMWWSHVHHLNCVKFKL